MIREKNDKLDKLVAQKISDFMIWDYRPYFRKNSLEQNQTKILCSVETIHLLAIIVSQAKQNQADGKGYYAQRGAGELSRRLHTILGRTQIRDRLMLLARYWFIHCDNSLPKKLMPDGKKHKEKCVIRPNAAFMTMFDPKQSTARNKFKKCSVAIGDNRDLGLQGFEMTVSYGYPEVPNFKIEDLDYGERELDDFNTKAAAKDDKAAELKKWQKHRDDFLHMAGRLWTGVRVSLEYGYEEPTWSVTRGQISSPQRKQRSDMSYTFARNGGRSTALAWYLYCTGEKKLDSKGKLVFDPTIAHRQYKRPDMSPSKFALEFHNITSERAYIEYMGERYEEGEKILLEWFSKEILEVGPKDGTSEHVRRNFVAGEKPLPQLPKNV